jgi:hypothetical protein
VDLAGFEPRDLRAGFPARRSPNLSYRPVMDQFMIRWLPSQFLAVLDLKRVLGSAATRPLDGLAPGRSSGRRPCTGEPTERLLAQDVLRRIVPSLRHLSPGKNS